MTVDPLETVRALERQITERLAAAAGPVQVVERARADGEAVRSRAVAEAERVAAQRAAAILEQAGVQAEQVRTAGGQRAARLRVRADERRADDVATVLAAVLPVTRPDAGA